MAGKYILITERATFYTPEGELKEGIREVAINLEDIEYDPSKAKVWNSHDGECQWSEIENVELKEE